MADSPADAPPDDSPEAVRLDAIAVGAQMSDQFIELLELWTQQMTALAGAGVDPTPLVQSLARMLRSAADQLDAGAAGGA